KKAEHLLLPFRELSFRKRHVPMNTNTRSRRVQINRSIAAVFPAARLKRPPRIIEQVAQAASRDPIRPEGGNGRLLGAIGSRNRDTSLRRILCSEPLHHIIRGGRTAGVKNLNAPGFGGFRRLCAA